VVVAVWAMRTMWTRTSMSMWSDSRAVLTMSTWTTLSSGTSFNLRELIGDNRSPFTDHSCAFFAIVGRAR
jgi:hypothetical protein